MLNLLMIVDDPEIALFSSQNGVRRLFVDLEYMGKDLRQKNLDTWKSRQTPADVTKIREAAPDAHLLVRINPMHDNSAAEIDDVIARGCDSVMLPMFSDRDTVLRFFDLLKGRVGGVPLAETKAGLDAIPDIVDTGVLQVLHIGLNDLHLDMGYQFMFQPLADGVLETACAAMRDGGVTFGIGGLARAREGIVSPDFLLGEHVRLGSTGAILSRSFHRGVTSLAALKSDMDFPGEIAKLQQIFANFQTMSPEELAQNQIEMRNRVADVVALIEMKKS